MNILIVESENDQYFIEALVKNFSDETDIFRIDEYRHSSLDEKKLTTQITNALTDISRGVSKIGVILDMDDSTKESRIGLINRCLEKSFSDSGYPKIDALLTETNKFIACQIDDYLTVSISCFFTNVDGKGELETVLKEISSQPSIFADCLYEGWLHCLNDKNKKYGKKGEPCDISDKEILKLWVDFYKRFDTLKRTDRDQKNTDWKGIMIGITKEGETLSRARGNEIFNMNHEKLNDIKEFLRMFN
jgi:hypothetical protein